VNEDVRVYMAAVVTGQRHGNRDREFRLRYTEARERTSQTNSGMAIINETYRQALAMRRTELLSGEERERAQEVDNARQKQV
jgi:hypothetical protein